MFRSIVGAERLMKGFLEGGRGRLLLVFALALALRIAYLVHIRGEVSFQVLPPDSQLFHEKALAILRGESWGDDAFYSAPLYPYVLALLYAIGGTGLLLVRIVQILLGSLTAVLVVLVAERVFDEPVPLLAGFVAALYAPLIFFDASILGTTLAVFLATLSVFLLLRSIGGVRRDLWSFLGGMSIGLTCLVRPNTIVLLPLWIFCLWVLHRGVRWVRPAALVLLGSALAISPVTVRNAVVCHDFVPISCHGGINFWIGNHPGAGGTFDAPPGIRGTPEQVNLVDSTRLARQDLGRDLKPSEVSAYWFRRGQDYIRENPGEYARLLLRKVRFFWNRTEIPLNVNFHFAQQSSSLLKIPLMHFGVIGPLALLGLGLSVRRWRVLLPVYALVATYFVGSVVFFVSGRYRLPAVPVLIISATFALWWFYGQARSARWKPLALALAVLVPLAYHANTCVDDYRIERSFARELGSIGTYYHSRGQLDEALGHYESSIRHDPDLWTAHNDRAVCLSDLGRWEEAREAFQMAIDLAPAWPDPWSNLGTALASQGRLPEAVVCWEKALQLDPTHGEAIENLQRARAILEEQARRESAGGLRFAVECP